MITLQQAKNLKPGDMLYSCLTRQGDGGPTRWRVSGQPRTWRTRPEEVEVPVKHGLYTHDRLYAHNLEDVALTAEEADNEIRARQERRKNRSVSLLTS